MRDPAFSSEHRKTLGTVDLHLFGVRHGILNEVSGPPYVESCEDEDYANLLAVANELSVARGDVLAIEPTGFGLPFAQDLTLKSILPSNIPHTPPLDGSLASPEFREVIADFLETARQKRHINPLVYAASHTLLRGITVNRADASRRGSALFQKALENQDPITRKETWLFYRNTCMLRCLGDIATNMKSPVEGISPVLLFPTSYVHPPRLARRLSAAGTPFRASLSPNLVGRLRHP